MTARTDFILGQETVAQGTRRTVPLPVSHLSDQTPVAMAVHVVHGTRPGPTVFLSGGIHGNELVGAEIIRRVLWAPGLARLRGTLLTVTLVNAFGFIACDRYLPDRRDLNRCFPGIESGSLGARLAHLFLHHM